MISANSKLLLEPYKGDGAVKATVNKGFATTKQKSTLVGLKAVIKGAVYSRTGDVIAVLNIGDLAFFKEEDLHTQAWAKTIFNCEAVEVPFIIAESSSVVMVKHASS